MLDNLVTTVFPADCRICGGPLLRAGFFPNRHECIEGVETQSTTLCGRCGEALDKEGVRFTAPFPAEGLLRSPCRVAPPAFGRAVAAMWSGSSSAAVRDARSREVELT